MTKYKKTKKRIARKTLIRRLDSVLSKYVRKKYSDSKGWTSCFTCGKRAHWKHIQNGHYISRKVLQLRYEEDNCRPQCVGCNIFKNGVPITFRENLVKELGEERVKEMEASRFAVFKVGDDWFEEKLIKYKT
jgi:hypothetical protein